MAEGFTVNSSTSLQGFMVRAEQLFREHKYLRFSWRLGKDRSLEQNRMFFELYTRIGQQLYGNDTELARRECKLTIGVPILRRDSEEFAEKYDRLVKPRSYEEKLDFMELLPVTSQFTLKQGQEYIDLVMNQYTLKGVDFGPLVEFSNA